jgi:hypothetical protein
MLLKVGLELLAPIAILHGIPESEIESIRGGLRAAAPGAHYLRARVPQVVFW